MGFKFNQRLAPFSASQVEAICKILGDTSSGLRGSEIGQLLRQTGIRDPDPELTKWQRLFNAFVEFQNEHEVGNHIIKFITLAMSPARYTSDPQTFKHRQAALNRVLSFKGMCLSDDGQMRRCRPATDLDDAVSRANRFHGALQQRRVHPDVLRFCTPEVLAENYFHAVFEAMKGVASRIRELSGLSGDGSELVTAAFSLGKDCKPVLAISALDSETLQGEQRGFANLLVGLFGVIRNPLAHQPKIEWEMTEQDALDVMSTISLVHRKLDGAYRFRQAY